MSRTKGAASFTFWPNGIVRAEGEEV
jgi:hypothetical protein